MDETNEQEKQQKLFHQVDLSALQDFSFGTQWAQEPKESGDRGPARPRREGRDRRDERPGGDRGPGRRESGPPSDRPDRRQGRRPSGPGADAPRPTEGGGRPQESGSRDAGPGPREGGARFGGPRQGGHRGEGRPERPMPPRPYESPVFDVAFYPEDQGFAAMAKAMRASARTYELFEIARLILAKPERAVLVIRRRPETEGGPVPPLFISVADGAPFATEEEAVNHALSRHLNHFFDQQEVEVEAPKGNFPSVSRCPFTQELLGPPNYHRYNQILQQHYNAKLASRMPFERFKSSLESVREPEAVNAWLEQMKKATRYTLKGLPEGETVAFDTIEDARTYLLANAREKLVRSADTARLSAKAADEAGGEIARAVHGALERQRRFPLDTANALRGRLRRESFNIFKRGSKGVTYVSAVRRKFRTPGQVFSDSIEALIHFLEAHPMFEAKRLPEELLGITPPEEGTESTLSQEESDRLRRLRLDLHWLVTEGYVSEYADGRLFAPPVMAEQQRKEAAGHDEEPSFAEEGAPAAAPAEPVRRPAPAAAEAVQAEAAEPSQPEAPAEPASEPSAEQAPSEEPAAPETSEDEAPKQA
jgi:hypothetical protein